MRWSQNILFVFPSVPLSQYYCVPPKICPERYFFLIDTYHYYFLPRPVATISGEAFSPQTTIPPVTPNPLVPNSADLGTVYLYFNWTANVQDISLFEIPVFVDGEEEVIIWMKLDGYCTRFGTQENSAQGYCHFTYTVYDPESLTVSGEFVAEGFLVNPTLPGKLTIIGGTGIFTGANGFIDISPVILDNATNPPLVVSPPEGADIFNGIAGYKHIFQVETDLNPRHKSITRVGGRGTSSNPTMRRGLGQTYRRGSKKSASSKSGGSGYVSVYTVAELWSDDGSIFLTKDLIFTVNSDLMYQNWSLWC